MILVGDELDRIGDVWLLGGIDEHTVGAAVGTGKAVGADKGSEAVGAVGAGAVGAEQTVRRTARGLTLDAAEHILSSVAAQTDLSRPLTLRFRRAKAVLSNSET